MNTCNGLKHWIVCILLISTGLVSATGIALLERSGNKLVVLMLEFDLERPDDTEVTIATDNF